MAIGGGPQGGIKGTQPEGIHDGGSQLCRFEIALPIILNGKVIAENNAEIGLKPPSAGPQAGAQAGGGHGGGQQPAMGLGPAIAGPPMGIPGGKDCIPAPGCP